MRDSVVRLRGLGFDPKVILDLGAYEGRWARTATDVFPTARILSFGAQPRPEPALQETAAECRNVEYTLGLLGELNEIMTERNMLKVDLIKFDTQGSELGILRGREGIGNKAETVISRCPASNATSGAIAALEVVDYMAQWGYKVVDIGDRHRGRGGILLQADPILVPQDSAWRMEESWLW